MDNIYDYIKADHKKVAGLFKQFEKAPSDKARKEFVTFIAQELVLHLEAEQETFYKELEKHSESVDEALHGDKEHTEIEQQLSIVLSSINSDNLQDEMKKLKEFVEHHVKDEENKIFKEAQKIFSDEDAYILRERMHDMKEKILTQQDKEVSKKIKTNKVERAVK
jgi:hemerythrin superfamily protein